MQGNVYGVYPLGFRRALRPGERKVDRNPDDRVTDEFVKWQQLRAGTDSWDDNRVAINLAVELFGDPKRWVMAQQDNPDLTRHAWLYLEDTVRFINTGTRKVNVYTGMSLIQMDQEKNARLPVSNRIPRLATHLTCSNELMLAQWLRQPSGFADMICSLTVFFGDTQPRGSVTLTT